MPECQAAVLRCMKHCHHEKPSSTVSVLGRNKGDMAGRKGMTKSDQKGEEEWDKMKMKKKDTKDKS